jgi:lysophospholipase L1-like esterase
MRLLFLGDSLVEFGNWQNRFPGHAVFNAGTAGETVAGLLADLPRHLRRCPDPERVCIMIGANNLLREEYGFLPDYERILNTLGNTLSPARITVTSLPPIRAAHLAPSAVARVNQGLLQLRRKKKTSFLDLFSAFHTDAPAVDACFTEDGVHLSDLGYAIWSACLARDLRQEP